MKRLLFLASFLFLSTCSLFAQGSVYRDKVRTPGGNDSSFPEITVCTSGASMLSIPCTTKATIYSNEALTTPLANPFRGDARGNVEFWAEAGTYVISYTRLQVGASYTKKVEIGGGVGGGAGETASLVHRDTAGGSDSNNGLNLGKAKSTLSAAISACPAVCQLYSTGDITISSDIFVGETTKKIDLFNLSGTWTATETLDIPANFSLNIAKGGSLAVATTKTVNIRGSFDAGDYQAFSLTGTGKVNPYRPAHMELNPRWWGAVGNNTYNCSGGTDDTTPIKAAVLAMEATGNPLQFPASAFTTTAEIPLSVSASQTIRGTVNPSVGAFRSQICATITGYVFNRPLDLGVGLGTVIEGLSLTSTDGGIFIGNGQTPTRIQHNQINATRGIIAPNSGALVIQDNLVRCNDTVTSTAYGIYLGGAAIAINNDVTLCRVGIAMGGAGSSILSGRFEVNHIGFETGLEYDGTGHQSTGVWAGGIRCEGNHYCGILHDIYGGTVSGVSSQGETANGSVTGLWISDIHETTVSGLSITGEYSGEGCLVDNAGQRNVTIQDSACSDSDGTPVAWDIDPAVTGIKYSQTNAPQNVICADSAGDAACGSSYTGSFVVDAADTATVVSSTSVTANSQIILQIDASLGTRLSVTCNTQAASVFNPRVTARTAGTSFTVTVDAGPTTDPLCMSYQVIN